MDLAQRLHTQRQATEVLTCLSKAWRFFPWAIRVTVSPVPIAVCQWISLRLRCCLRGVCVWKSDAGWGRRFRAVNRRGSLAVFTVGLSGTLDGALQRLLFSRMRSEGFPFISGGLGVEAVFARSCSRVRNRPQPFAAVRGEAISVCYWGSSWKRVFDGSASAVFVGPVRAS